MTVDVPAPPATRDGVAWTCRAVFEDFAGDDTSGEPIARVEASNLAMNGGVSLLWEAVLGNGTAVAGQALTFLSAANAAIGAGDGTTAAAATQTDLVGANKLRKGMDSGFPSHVDGTDAAARQIVFRATFSTAEANFTWGEVAIFNSSTAGAGRMLNRIVQAIGAKTSAVSRVATITITGN